MSMFRSPVYLDVDTLVPLANYHDIEVMVDVQVSQRQRGQRSGRLGGSLGVSGAGLEGGFGRDSESETTEARTIKDDPASALNRLLDTLAGDGLVTDISDQTVLMKRQLVELDGEWEIAPATDAGALLAGMVDLMAQNPAAMSNSELPDEFVAALVTTSPRSGPIVLDMTSRSGQEIRALALLNAEHVANGSTLDALEGDRSVFGIIDTVITEGQTYPLEKFFLSGFGRAVRRSIKPEELLQAMSESFERSLTVDDLRPIGPLVAVRAVAVY